MSSSQRNAGYCGNLSGTRPEEDWQKPPFSPLTGRPLPVEMGSPEREANYVDFDAVETAALRYGLKVGINLTAEDNCVVVDFDDAFKDGVLDSTVGNSVGTLTLVY